MRMRQRPARAGVRSAGYTGWVPVRAQLRLQGALFVCSGLLLRGLGLAVVHGTRAGQLCAARVPIAM